MTESTPKRVNLGAPLEASVSSVNETTRIPVSSAHNSNPVAFSAKRLYRSGENKWVTRDIAALDFLLGIPLATEPGIVTTGWQLKQRDEVDSSGDDEERHKQSNKHNTWWAKWIYSFEEPQQPPQYPEPGELEGPTRTAHAPGRRLDGDVAVRVQIPLTLQAGSIVTQHRTIARLSALREWELATAHGLTPIQQPPMLDGRLFFSADSSYPVAVFSVIRYEPKKEEAAIRRRKLEAIGGGGSQFVLPKRDWRGISYRAILPRYSGDDDKRDKAFNRFLREDEKNDGDDHDDSSASSEDSDVYVPGLLDDPEMVLGRHRTVMIGDAVTGPIASSSIQFVKPALLKAELNKQFRDRFDGWEPPKSARKYIGARVVQGNYVLMDPANDEHDDQSYERRRNRQGSVGSVTSMSNSDSGTGGCGGTPEKVIRMPPSLTLSKIRSLKRQALLAAVRAKLELGTLALACVYFERLCLDCRVDKSNRRLVFAACLLLAAKLNEPNVGLVNAYSDDSGSDDESNLLYLIKPNKRSNKMFASLLLFFTQDWSLSLKQLFETEWPVFAALGFSLHTNPLHVAFHFKRLLKTLEWNPLEYLGKTMYTQWQNTLADEEERRVKREGRHNARRKRKEEQLLNLHIEMENEYRRKSERHTITDKEDKQTNVTEKDDEEELIESHGNTTKKKYVTERRIKLFNRFALRRSVSHERITDIGHEHQMMMTATDHQVRRRSTGVSLSPSMPVIASTFPETVSATDIAININNPDSDDAKSIGLYLDGDV